MADTHIYDIDPNALDREWLAQPKLYHKYAMRLVDARAELEKQKAGLDIVWAEVDRKIRRNPKKYGRGQKLTEKMIEAIINASVEYQGALSDLQREKHNVDVLQVAVDTLDQRKKALENLVSLRLADYYSEPRMPKNGSDEYQKRRARTAGRQ